MACLEQSREPEVYPHCGALPRSRSVSIPVFNYHLIASNIVQPGAAQSPAPSRPTRLAPVKSRCTLAGSASTSLTSILADPTAFDSLHLLPLHLPPAAPSLQLASPLLTLAPLMRSNPCSPRPSPRSSTNHPVTMFSNASFPHASPRTPSTNLIGRIPPLRALSPHSSP